MSKSSGRRGFGRGSGTVTVIEQRVHRSAAENARFAFILTAIVVSLVALTVASDHMHPLLAVFVAAPIAAFCGALVWLLVRIWPVLRLIWWWTPEIFATVTTAWLWTAIATATPALVTLAILAVSVGLPAAVPVTRRWFVALAWCVIVRHRLRVCFSQFIIANKSGSLPLILAAIPTRVGERVWVVLRPGLSLELLTKQLDKIAVACHALPGGVVVDKAGSGSAAFVRFDIKRREVLSAQVDSPLIDFLGPELDFEVADKRSATVIGGLDLTDIPNDEPAATAATAKPNGNSSNNKKKTADRADDAADDDVSQWI
ncbi:hypothetical protein ACFY36_36100 [Actinoplanes sp. NPDC000266]